MMIVPVASPVEYATTRRCKLSARCGPISGCSSPPPSEADGEGLRSERRRGPDAESKLKVPLLGAAARHGSNSASDRVRDACAEASAAKASTSAAAAAIPLMTCSPFGLGLTPARQRYTA